MGETTKTSALVLSPPYRVTPHLIQDTRARYHLSFNQMDMRMGYSKGSHMCSHAFHHPAKYLKPNFEAKFKQMLAEVKRERRDVHEVTFLNDLTELPREFRVYKLPVACKGHKVPVVGLPRAGYCDRECRTLFKRKRH